MIIFHIFFIFLDIPQRLNGEVSGNINGIRISSANLHSYVNANEGLAYTAISPLPDRISYSMQSLSPMGELIGWLFAVPSGKGINGFTQTGEFGAGGGYLYFRLDIILVKGLSKHTLNMYFFRYENRP